MTVYEDWIRGQCSENVYGQCREVSAEMHKVFPELRHVRGHVYCGWGKRAHWWLETKDGTVVDPTAAQFPLIFSYKEWHEGEALLVGKCQHCGEEIWRADNSPEMFCSNDCAEQAAQELSCKGVELWDTI